jgi:hypothetical protein
MAIARTVKTFGVDGTGQATLAHWAGAFDVSSRPFVVDGDELILSYVPGVGCFWMNSFIPAVVWIVF